MDFTVISNQVNDIQYECWDADQKRKGKRDNPFIALIHREGKWNEQKQKR